MKKNNFDWFLIILLFTAFVIRFILSFSWHELLWDSGVYVGIGKYIFSLGNAGLFEHIRPVIMPFFLGFFWKLHLSPLFFGRLLETILFTLSIALLYSLTKYWFDKRSAVFASILFAFSPIFFYLTFHPYTEIPSIFFILLALWLFTKNAFITSGISLGLAFLTKFPAGIFLPIVLFILLLKKQFKNIFYVFLGFVIITLPYLIFSWVFFNNPFATLLAAKSIINKVLGCNFLNSKSWWFYFEVFIKESWLYIFLIIGLIKSWFEKNKNLLLSLCFFIPFIYLTIMQCKEYRYATLFLPFAVMFTGKGLNTVTNLFKRKYRKILFISLVFLVIILTLFSAFSLFKEKNIAPGQAENEFFNFFKNKDVKGEVWVSNPLFSLYSDVKLNKIYYPVYDENIAIEFQNYVKENKNKISYIALDNCGGGIFCSNNLCINAARNLVSLLDSEFNLAFNKKQGLCWFKIWSSA